MVTDKMGNILEMKNSGLYLHLVKESHPRQLFKKTKEGFIRNVKSSNILKGKYIGLNARGLYMLLDDYDQEFIFIGVHGKYYKISILDILSLDRYLWFRRQGFELQKFISLNELERWNKLEED